MEMGLSTHVIGHDEMGNASSAAEYMMWNINPIITELILYSGHLSAAFGRKAVSKSI